MFGSVQRFGTVSRKPFLNRGTVRRGGERGIILEYVKLPYERKNMLLHIFRLEAKASPKRPALNGIGRKSRARRVEDIIGKESAVAERMPFMPQTVLLRPDVSPAPKSMSAGRGSKDRSGTRRTWPKERGRRDCFGLDGEKGVSPDEVTCESQCPARKFSLLDQALTWFHVTPDIRG